jgi:hypothetical protein
MKKEDQELHSQNFRESRGNNDKRQETFFKTGDISADCKNDRLTFRWQNKHGKYSRLSADFENNLTFIQTFCREGNVTVG